MVAENNWMIFFIDEGTKITHHNEVLIELSHDQVHE
jgi:hypothetical protein